MCGIAGIHRFDRGPVDRVTLESMAGQLKHRGPDDSGIWTGPGVGFAHTRLSIIDLSGSKQPMTSADGRWSLVFNGEIFNYRRLRSELSYPFRTEGDTEVVLAGIASHGLKYVERLVGQFAFAVHDAHSRTTHLVRDRLGVLPLAYYVNSERLVFGSEIKSILAALPATPDVDLASLDDYLFGRSVPSPHTLFSGVSKVRPGHRLEIASDGEVTDVTYWRPPDEDSAHRWTADDAVNAVDDAITEAVRSSLVADVPVGAYLSGGVDSSLIVAKIAAARGRDRVQTFSAGFGDPRHDELPWAEMVSKHVGTDHHQVHVRASDFESLWSRLTWHRDAPISEPADIAVFRLAEDARQSVTVILSGEGGDELFAGYPKYAAARAVAGFARLPLHARQRLAASLDERLPARLARGRIALRAAAAATAEERYRTWFAPFTTRERETLLGGVAGPQWHDAPTVPATDTIREMLLTDLWAWLPDNLLERGDRMSMAASLELRPPLLDHRLVELAFRMPSRFKVRKGQTKWVLKEVARRHLPNDVVDRRKVGFRVPLDQWFRSGLRDSARDLLTGPTSFVADTLDKRLVRNLLDRHESGRHSEEIRIFTLMSLEVWHRTFFRQQPTF